MKRFLTILTLSFIVCLIPFSGITAQEKKSEQKIKVIVDDGSGTKVVIDTLIKDGLTKDTVIVKGGKMVFIGHSGVEKINRHTDGSGNVYVYVSSDGDEPAKDSRSVTVVSSDDATWTVKDSEGKNEKTERTIYISDGKSNDKKIEKTYSVTVSKDDNESPEYETRSIIAKDGIVVTVEGNDETKVKELVKEIQQKMGVQPPEADTDGAGKVSTKKAVKK
ncbi:MAG: hypothetical protein IPJ16_14815 [Bacteroidales bacterium]|nr:hypothetical protein [Bacteroidales bacterium]